MSSYRKTMSEVYNNMYVSKNDTLKPIKEEVDLDEAQVLAHGGKGQYKVTSGGGVTTVKFKGKVVSSGDFDQGADGWFMNIKGEKGQKFFDTAQDMADYFAKNKITEEVECDCDCGKSPCEKCGQDHHGIVEAVSMAQQAAIAISKKERGNKPKKEEVKLDELKPPSRHVGKSQKNPDMFAVYDQEEKEVELFKDKKDAEEYAVKNHDALMGHDKSKNVKEDEIDEGFSPKEIKMAIGVASDKRYAGGNMTGAAAAIDKIKKGLSDHPQVAAVLRRQNEEVGIDEASARADAMKAMRKGKSIDPADVDNVASDDDVKAASKNIMMQLRKAINLRGTMAVEFGDKKKVKVSAKIAQAATSKYNSFRRPADKEKFQAKIAKSYKDMLQGIKESTIKESKFGVINKQLKGEK
jgi:hypothetical protein